MVFVYKIGGDWERDGVAYTVDFVGVVESKRRLMDGWFLSLDEAMQFEQSEQGEQESVADTNGDGKLSIDEARSYLESAGVAYEEGLHWKKVVALAEQHMKGER